MCLFQMSEETKCVICNEVLSTGMVTTLGVKGAGTFNNASISRKSQLRIDPGTKVHRRCHQRYTNKKAVAAAVEKLRLETTAAPTLRSTSTFDIRNDCLFCGKYLFKRIKKDIDIFPVRTENQFLLSIKEKCLARNDQWSQVVLGRLEYCQDLHALEVKYHQTCSVNFRTGKEMPSSFADDRDDAKVASRGRPVSENSKDAFDHVVSYLEMHEDETLTIQNLVKEMERYGSDVYTPRYLKRKLKEHYGETLFFMERDGLSDVVALRENASKILFSFHHTEKCKSEEAEKERIIQTAARLIKADIKALSHDKSTYPSISNISSCDANNEFLPHSVDMFLKSLLPLSDGPLKVASIGQAIIQATRSKTLIAPLQIALGVQIYHKTGSRQIVDTLHKLGFCSSYHEIRKFQKCAATECGEHATTEPEESFVQFVADNIDHNIATLDGLNTFHGMGMIAVHTPQSPKIRTIKREEISMEEIRKLAQVNIVYCDPKTKPTPLRYKALSVFDVHNSLANVDLLWKTSWIFHRNRPLWSGFMQKIATDEQCNVRSSVEFLPIIDLKPTDEACILSTLLHLAKEAKSYQKTPIITFDQPLYWKAKMILQKNETDETIGNIVLRLGSFHTAMSFLGCIGHVMEGSGIENVLQVCYAPNTVPYIMNGKAYSRAFRAHLLVDSALHALLMCDIFSLPIPAIEDPTEDQQNGKSNTTGSTSVTEPLEVTAKHINDDHQEIHALVEGLMTQNIPIELLAEDARFQRIEDSLLRKRQELTGRKTAQLWYTYLDMVMLLRNFIQAERTGNWLLHLSTLQKMLPYFAATGHNLYLKSAYIYVTSMKELEATHPDVHEAFLSGHHVVRRTNEYWRGLSTDLTIEQTLMKSIKSTGGLTRGRGMDETQRALWVMSMPVCAEMNEALTVLTDDISSTNDHKELGRNRCVRDNQDIHKVISYISDRNPFMGDEGLRNISTGQVADASVTAHMAKVVGDAIVTSIVQENALTFSYKRKNQIVNMSAKSACQLKDTTIPVDPKLLFQRLTTVAGVIMEESDDAMEYELCSFPPALFDSSGVPLEARKPAIRDAVCAFCKGSAERTDLPHEDIAYVLDGGSLLHRLNWTRGLSIGAIVSESCKLVDSKYGSCYVVFDGYNEEPSTKDVTHMRRNGSSGVRIAFDSKSVLQTTKELFLKHLSNKHSFIQHFGAALEQSGHTVIYSRQDADVDIVMTAIALSEDHNVAVIGEDTDLLCLLCAHFIESRKNVYFQSAKQERRVYCVRQIQAHLGEHSRRLLFCHALLGCDTTSRLYGIGKAAALKKLQDEEFSKVADVFLNPSSSKHEVIEAGEKALLIIYGFGSVSNLNTARVIRFKEKIARSAVYVEPQTLPPTSAAAKYHSLRVFLQVQDWLGTIQEGEMLPTDWGYHEQNGKLYPIMTDLPPAPEKLLAVVTCACKSGCSTMRCSCRKHGLKCTHACSGCRGQMCSNESVSHNTWSEGDMNDTDNAL